MKVEEAQEFLGQASNKASPPEENHIKIGSIVYLKSGSPAMIVEDTDHGYDCVWFVKGQPLHGTNRDRFPLEVLTTEKPQ